MKLFVPSLWLLVMLGCGVTETGNPVPADVTVQARSSSPDRVDVGAPAGVTSVEEAWLAIDRIRFVRGTVCDGPGEQEIDADGPFVRDAAALVPDPIAATLPPDAYCRVRLRLEPAEDVGEGPTELRDHTLYVSGVRSDGVPWVFRSREDFDLDVRSVEPIPFEEATDALVVSLDVARWLEAIDLDTVAPADGVVRIEAGSNDGLRIALEEQLASIFDLLDDRQD